MFLNVWKRLRSRRTPMAYLRVPHGASLSLRGCPGRLGSECLDLFARPFMMAQRYFDLIDPVNQAATIGRYGQVPPPATPQLNHVSADRTYITWMAKSNLAPMRDQGNSCLKIYFIFLLIYSWYSDPWNSHSLKIKFRVRHVFILCESQIMVIPIDW